MNNIILYFVFGIIILFGSCCPKITSNVNTTTTIHDTSTIEVKIKEIDTIITSDTLTQVIQLDCDSLGRVHIIGENINKGKRSQLKTKLSNNILYNKFLCDSLYIQLTSKDSLINRLINEKTTIETTKIVVKKEIPVWVWILIGGLFSFSIYSRFFK